MSDKINTAVAVNCVYCNMPIGPFGGIHTSGGVTYHASCYKNYLEGQDNFAKYTPVDGVKPITGRHLVIDAASKAVLSDRNKAYGNPEDNFRNIASLWNTWFAAAGRLTAFTPTDVAHMMILMKMARLSTNPLHVDSIVDVAGYAACAGDFAFAGGEKKEGST